MVLPVVDQVAQSNVQTVNKALVQYIGRSLKPSGQQTPLLEFIGVCTGWDVEEDNFGNNNVLFDFSQVQVMRLREGESGYPYDTAQLRIKFSESQESVFGFLVTSLDGAMQITSADSNIEHAVGKQWHMNSKWYNWGDIKGAKRTDQQNNVWGLIWGFDTNLQAQPDTSQTPNPNVVEHTTPATNQVNTAIRPQVAGAALAAGQLVVPIPAQVVVATPNTPVPVGVSTVPIVPVTPIAVTAHIAPPVPAVPVTPAVPVVPIIPAVPEAPAPVTPKVDAPTRALQLLHGSDKTTFVPAVVSDPIVRGDQDVMTGIINDTLIPSWLAGGIVTLDPTTQIFTVVAMQTP